MASIASCVCATTVDSTCLDCLTASLERYVTKGFEALVPMLAETIVRHLHQLGYTQLFDEARCSPQLVCRSFIGHGLRCIGLIDMPVEILSIIFYEAARGFHPASRSFRKLRASISLTCTLFHGVVIAIPSYWAVLSITPFTTSFTVKRFLENAAGRPFRLAIVNSGVFVQSTGSYKHCAPDITLILRSLLSVNPPPRLVGVDIAATNTETFTAVLDVLRSSSGLPIQTFALNSTKATLGFMHPLIYHRVPFRHLTRLELRSVTFPHALATPQPLLEELSLITLPHESWPTVNEFLNLFSVSPRLHTLVMNAVGIRTVPSEETDIPQTPIELQTLRVLQLSFGLYSPTVSLSLLNWLRHIRTPNLSHVDLYFANDDELKAYLQAGLSFVGPSFAIAGNMQSERVIRSLFLTLGAVEKLDIVRCRSPGLSTFLKMLGDTVDDGSLVLPRLTALCVVGRPWNSMYEGLLGRSSRGSFLQSLELVSLKDREAGYVPPEDVAVYLELMELLPSTCLSWSRWEPSRAWVPYEDLLSAIFL